ncbi:MAG: hypothetical protein J6V68_03705 [Clostridia bacterium]|nr:hypothetical protein [Clostridia bacterium]
MKSLKLYNPSVFSARDFWSLTGRSVNFTAGDCLKGFSSAKICDEFDGDDLFYAKFDGGFIRVLLSGEIFVSSIGATNCFLSVNCLNYAFTLIKKYSNNCGFYISDGTSAFIFDADCNEIKSFSITSDFAVFYKARLVLIKNRQIVVFSPMLLVEDSFVLSPNFDCEKAVFACVFLDAIFIVFKKGIVKVSENIDKEFSITRVIDTIDVTDGTVSFSGNSINFIADGMFNSFKGNSIVTHSLPDEFIPYLIDGGFDFKSVSSLDDYALFIYDNGEFLTAISIKNSKEVSYLKRPYYAFFDTVYLNKKQEVKFEWESVYTHFNKSNIKSLKKIKCDTTTPCVLTVFSRKSAKNYTLSAGENLLKVDLKGDEFKVKIVSFDLNTVVSKLEFIYS